MNRDHITQSVMSQAFSSSRTQKAFLFGSLGDTKNPFPWKKRIIWKF